MINMTEAQVYARIAEKISAITGVVLGEKQSGLIQSRVSKRIRDLGLKSAQDYWDYLSESHEEEVSVLISLLTTHHTFFFREWAHFEYLESVLPEIVSRLKANGRRSLRIWCAACSFGQEVYSLAMFLEDKLKRLDPSLKFEIFGSDVDEKSVKVAQNGVYRWHEVQKIPAFYLSAHWARGKEEIADFVKAKNSIRSACRFDVVNLMDVKSKMKDEKFDLIFCRNVFIYFTREQIERISNELGRHLHGAGLLFLGLSESLYDLKVSFKHLGKSVYQTLTLDPAQAVTQSAAQNVSARPATVAAKSSPAVTQVKRPEPIQNIPSRPVVPEKTGPIRVFCVDDSPSVLKILQTLVNSGGGFQVVGTALNGVEAAKKLPEAKADVVTLDIHMPELDGIEYLRRHFNAQHPPVVMISSVARGDAKFALKAMEYGASDYIEKPSLDNLASKKDEILAKLKLVARTPRREKFDAKGLDASFSKVLLVSDAGQKLIVLPTTLASRSSWGMVLKGIDRPHPPIVLAVDALPQLLDDLIEPLSRELGLSILRYKEGLKPDQNRIYLAHQDEADRFVRKPHKHLPAIGVIGELTPASGKKVLEWPNARLVIEDSPFGSSSVMGDLRRRSVLSVPLTSFAYELTKLVAGAEEDAA